MSPDAPPRDPEKTVMLTVVVSADAIPFLEVLASLGPVGPTVEDLIAHLAESAAEGARRPGAWERAWIYQCIGGSWEAGLMRDPKAPWSTMPRPRSATTEG